MSTNEYFQRVGLTVLIAVVLLVLVKVADGANHNLGTVSLPKWAQSYLIGADHEK